MKKKPLESLKKNLPVFRSAIKRKANKQVNMWEKSYTTVKIFPHRFSFFPRLPSRQFKACRQKGRKVRKTSFHPWDGVHLGGFFLLLDIFGDVNVRRGERKFLLLSITHVSDLMVVTSLVLLVSSFVRRANVWPRSRRTLCIKMMSFGSLSPLEFVMVRTMILKLNQRSELKTKSQI